MVVAKVRQESIGNILRLLTEHVFQIFQHFDIRPHNISYELQVCRNQRESKYERLIQSLEQIKSTLTVKPAGFYMHVTPRKDMLIDPTLSGTASSSAQAVTKHPNAEGEADIETGSRTKL